jgi:hypothetical protein
MRKIKFAALGLGVLFVGAQFCRPARTNPPEDPAASFTAVARPPAAAARVVARACHDCHSNQTVWPWYSNVAPVSWLVTSDVNEGRAHLNFSQWNIYSPEMSKIRLRSVCREVREGDMPPKYYTPLHPDARLTAEDVSALCGMAGS